MLARTASAKTPLKRQNSSIQSSHQHLAIVEVEYSRSRRRFARGCRGPPLRPFPRGRRPPHREPPSSSGRRTCRSSPFPSTPSWSPPRLPGLPAAPTMKRKARGGGGPSTRTDAEDGHTLSTSENTRSDAAASWTGRAAALLMQQSRGNLSREASASQLVFCILGYYTGTAVADQDLRGHSSIGIQPGAETFDIGDAASLNEIYKAARKPAGFIPYGQRIAAHTWNVCNGMYGMECMECTVFSSHLAPV